jgi:hypothetical protein
MITAAICRKIAGVLLVVALPGIACHGYYAYEAAAGANIVWRIAIVLAYPAILIAVAWWLLVLCSPRRARRE